MFIWVLDQNITLISYSIMWMELGDDYQVQSWEKATVAAGTNNDNYCLEYEPELYMFNSLKE